MSELKPYKGGYYLWKFVPSVPLAATFAVLFLIATIGQAWRIYRFRLWFCLPMVVGGIMMFAGYITRVKASSATDKLMPYAIQNVFILLPPVLFAASIYMVLGRLIRCLRGEKYSFVPTGWLTKIFLAADIVSLMVQGSASGLMATGNNAVLCQWIVVAGLVIQLVAFGLFIATAGTFHYRSRRIAASAASTWNLTKSIFNMLYAVSALIMFRSVFRIVEFALGYDGYPLSHEWTLYVFDGIPMLTVMIVYFIWYPANLDAENDRHVRASSQDVLTSSDINLSKPGRVQEGGQRDW